MSYENKVARKVKSMPPLSTTTMDIIKLIAQEDYATEDIVRLIETDMTLAGRCLQAVNSPAIGLRAKVVTIQRAVILLGANTVADIALQTGMTELFNFNLTGYSSTAEELWRHCLRTAIASRRVASEILCSKTGDVAYAAGLLHDIGKVIISEFLEEQSDNLFSGTETDSDRDFLEAENALFGTDHTRVGARIAEKWHLPTAFQMAIRYHHQPGNAPEEWRELCLAVHIGDMLAMLVGEGTALDNMSYSIDPMVDKYIMRDKNWEMKTFPRLLLNIDTECQKAANLCSGMGGADV